MSTPPMTPILMTARLRLRAHLRADLPACAAMWADPVVVRHTIGAPSPEQRTWMRILSYRGHWELMGYGYWAVEERSSGRYVGELGFADFRRGMGPAVDLFPELGWALSPEVHGRGYATEALLAATAWADAKWGAGSRTVCIVHPENKASLRVAEKIGFRPTGRAEKGGEPEIILHRGRPTP
jgi:RimJ/RimL family protein N-acetyltransferase